MGMQTEEGQQGAWGMRVFEDTDVVPRVKRASLAGWQGRAGVAGGGIRKVQPSDCLRISRFHLSVHLSLVTVYP